MYASEHLSLALLENIVHADWSLIPDDLVRFRIEVPDGVTVAAREPDELPPGWRTYPPDPALAEIGRAWLDARTSAVLVVPSAVVPMESNAILDPSHPDFARLLVGEPEDFPIDRRLAKEA